MFALRPKSTIATRGAPLGRVAHLDTAPSGETWPTKSWSSQRGQRPGARRPPPSGSVSPGAVTMPAERAVRRAGGGRGPACPRRRSPGCPSSRRSVASWRGLLERPRRSRWRRRGPQPRPLGLVVVADPAVVADQRVGHHHDLARVGGIRADLLVAGLARVHDEVAAGRDAAPRRRCPGRPCRPRAPAARDRASPTRGSTTNAASGTGRPDQRATRPPGGPLGTARGARTRKRHRPGGRGGRVVRMDARASFPASRDRFAGLTGPAAKERPDRSMGRRGSGGPATRVAACRDRDALRELAQRRDPAVTCPRRSAARLVRVDDP